MGGSLAVTIRTPDGEWHKMERWTNSSFWSFADPRFMACDNDVVSDYLDTWYEMCDAYDDGSYHETAQMAGQYCDPNGSRDKIMPSEYGIVFIDFITKTFYNMNGYTSYDGIDDVKVKLLARNMSFDDFDRDFLENIWPRINALQTLDREQGKLVQEPLKFNSLDELLKHNAALDMAAFTRYMFDMGDWKYKDFQDDSNGSLQMLAALDADGVELNDEERQGFEKFRVYEDEDMD